MAPVFNSAIVNVTFGAVSVKPSAVMLFENITSGACRIKFADVFAIEKKSNAASREAIPPPPPVHHQSKARSRHGLLQLECV